MVLRFYRFAVIAPYVLVVSGAAAHLHSHEHLDHSGPAAPHVENHQAGCSESSDSSHCALCYHLTAGSRTTIPAVAALWLPEVAEIGAGRRDLPVPLLRAFSPLCARAPPVA